MTPPALMRNFLRACADYDELSESIPLGPITIPHRAERDGRLYWDLVLHCSVLRKFVSPDDDVAMKRVVEAMRIWMTPHMSVEVDEHLAALAELLEDPFEFGSFDYALGAMEPVASGRLVQHLLYGWHLHGDAEKREAYEGLPCDSAMLAMSDWTAEVSRRLSVTRQTIALVERDAPF